MVNVETWKNIRESLNESGVTLVAVSKKKPAEDIMELYNLGQRDFGENYVQQMVEKHEVLPPDIRWHFIGHLQTNKVKSVAPFVALIQAVDSEKLLMEIGKEAGKCNRVIDVLLQVHIAMEETKFGLDEAELNQLVKNYFANTLIMSQVRICGLMGMATNTTDEKVVFNELEGLHSLFLQLKNNQFIQRPEFNTLSMGMSADYEMAVKAGSNMVRIGSLLFGARS